MIIRISGDGQYQVEDGMLDQLNAVDDALQEAVQARDEERFARQLERLMALVRDAGRRLDDEHLEPSDVILPPDDVSLEEVAGGMSAEGLLPDLA